MCHLTANCNIDTFFHQQFRLFILWRIEYERDSFGNALGSYGKAMLNVPDFSNMRNTQSDIRSSDDDRKAE